MDIGSITHNGLDMVINLKKTTKGNVLYMLLCGVNYYEISRI
jgi:hypothetical protein